MDAQRLISLVVFGVLLALPGQAISEEKLAPNQIPGSTKVSAEEVFVLFEREPELVIIDARIRMDRKQGYIEGSQSLPDVETNCTSLKPFIKAKDAPALFYCNGPKCERSTKSVIKALACGYSNVYWFRGGFEEWKAKGYPMLKN